MRAACLSLMNAAPELPLSRALLPPLAADRAAFQSVAGDVQAPRGIDPEGHPRAPTGRAACARACRLAAEMRERDLGV